MTVPLWVVLAPMMFAVGAGTAFLAGSVVNLAGPRLVKRLNVWDRYTPGQRRALLAAASCSWAAFCPLELLAPVGDDDMVLAREGEA